MQFASPGMARDRPSPYGNPRSPAWRGTGMSPRRRDLPVSMQFAFPGMARDRPSPYGNPRSPAWRGTGPRPTGRRVPMHGEGQALALRTEGTWFHVHQHQKSKSASAANLSTKVASGIAPRSPSSRLRTLTVRFSCSRPPMISM